MAGPFAFLAPLLSAFAPAAAGATAAGAGAAATGIGSLMSQMIPQMAISGLGTLAMGGSPQDALMRGAMAGMQGMAAPAMGGQLTNIQQLSSAGAPTPVAPPAPGAASAGIPAMLPKAPGQLADAFGAGSGANQFGMPGAGPLSFPGQGQGAGPINHMQPVVPDLGLSMGQGPAGPMPSAPMPATAGVGPSPVVSPATPAAAPAAAPAEEAEKGGLASLITPQNLMLAGLAASMLPMRGAGGGGGAGPMDAARPLTFDELGPGHGDYYNRRTGLRERRASDAEAR
jgi:hypothetical protein